MGKNSARILHIKNLIKACNYLKTDHITKEYLIDLKGQIGYKKKTKSIHKKRQKQKAEWKKKYLDYLKSDEWAKIRIHMLEANNYTCQRCGQKKFRARLHVHHKTYDRLFKEEFEDLELLCDKCHSEEHKTVTKNKVKMKK